MDNNIVSVEGKGKWAVLFNASGNPISWDEIILIDEDSDTVTLENRGQYPKRLVMECESADGAQEAFDLMLKNVEKEELLQEGCL